MIRKIATWAKRAVLGLALSLSVAPVAMAQAPTIYTNAVYPAAVFTAANQTSSAITFGNNPSGNGGSYAVGNISVTGTALTTVTFAVQGSSDGGNTYYALNINAINAPATSSTTVTATSAGVYQVNLSGITNVKFVTSGTFTATSVSIVLTASPNGLIARAGTAGAPVQSVSNIDGSETINPTTGAVVSSLNPAHSNTFTAVQTAPAFYGSSVSSGPYVNIFDEFASAASNWNAAALGSPTGNSWGSTTTNNTTNHVGINQITSGTGGTGTGEYARYGGQTFISTPNSAAPTWTLEFMVFPGSLPGTTVGAFQVGMADTIFPPVVPSTDGYTFVLSSADGVVNDWYCTVGTTLTNTTVVATLAWTRLSITNDGTNIHYYINGAEATACRTAIASAPSGAQEPFLMSKALSASSIVMYIDYMAFLDNVVR